LTDPDGTFAVDVVGERVHVLAFDGTGWTSVTDLGSPLGRVPPVDTARGPEGAGDGVTFQIDLAGADAVFNGIVVRDQGSWRYADFDCGTTAVACAGDPGNATRYAVNGTEVDGTFHSEPNDCDPSCAGGTHYDVAWRWNPTYGTFAVASSRVLPTLSQ
jgi:hypothetical protein